MKTITPLIILFIFTFVTIAQEVSISKGDIPTKEFNIKEMIDSAIYNINIKHKTWLPLNYSKMLKFKNDKIYSIIVGAKYQEPIIIEKIIGKNMYDSLCKKIALQNTDNFGSQYIYSLNNGFHCYRLFFQEILTIDITIIDPSIDSEKEYSFVVGTNNLSIHTISTKKR